MRTMRQLRGHPVQRGRRHDGCRLRPRPTAAAGVELAPRKQWQSGMKKLGVDVSGRIDDGPSVGRTIGRLTDLGWGARLRKVLAEPDGPAAVRFGQRQLGAHAVFNPPSCLVTASAVATSARARSLISLSVNDFPICIEATMT